MAFKDIKGQDSPIQRLTKNLEQERLASSYLFTGPEGIGKGLVAVNFAKAINCLKEKYYACDSCSSCLKIDKNQHPDVHIIDAFVTAVNENTKEYAPASFPIRQQVKAQRTETESSEIKIECIRQLQREINLKPYEGRQKVFIVKDAHNLTAEASNAFLKTIEEPAAHSVIILISAKPELLFKTIVSRCQIVKFHGLRREELALILKNEYHIEDEFVHFLSYFSEGRLGEALRLKDVDILQKKNKVINDFISSDRNVFENMRSIQREIVRDNLNILVTWVRDIYLLKAQLPYHEIINLDRKQDLLEACGRYSFTDLERIISCINDSFFYLSQNINVKLLLSNIKATLTV